MSHRDHWELVRAMGCCICGGLAQIHHCHGGSINDWLGKERAPGMGQRQNHFLVIPLCAHHHVGDHGIDRIGVKEWEAHYWTQWHFLRVVNDWIHLRRPGYSLWELAGISEPVPPVTADEYREKLRQTTSTQQEKGNE